MEADKKIIIALDTPREKEALYLARTLLPQVSYFKVGLELFCSCGPGIVYRLKEMGASIFLDLKFHDIPRTTAGAAGAALKMGVDMINVHISGGGEMVAKTVEHLKKIAEPGQKIPLVLGVTVLTSLSEESLYRELGINRPMWQQVEELAVLGQQKGLGGVVVSPREAAKVRERCGPGFLIVTPGVRPLWAGRQDQKRVMTPADALQAGADYLLIGIPVTGADSPAKALAKILQEIP